MQDYPLRSVTIDFYGNQLITIEKDGTIYVAMKPVVEGMGLNWASQSVKLRKNKEKYRCCDIAIPTPGGIQKMLCLPLTKLNGCFFSVNPLKVSPGIRKMVSLYQEECFVALYDYWHKGVAINPRAVFKENPGPDSLRDITIKLLTDETESAFNLLRKIGHRAYLIKGVQKRAIANFLHWQVRYSQGAKISLRFTPLVFALLVVRLSVVGV